jgi:hypothetical protein
MWDKKSWVDISMDEMSMDEMSMDENFMKCPSIKLLSFEQTILVGTKFCLRQFWQNMGLATFWEIWPFFADVDRGAAPLDSVPDGLPRLQPDP